MECLEITIRRIDFKSGEGLGNGIHRLAVKLPGFLQILEVFVLDPFICCICLHCSYLSVRSHNYRRARLYLLFVVEPAGILPEVALRRLRDVPSRLFET